MKRRHHALSAGGIRASDAASLSRGVISAGSNVPQHGSGKGQVREVKESPSGATEGDSSQERKGRKGGVGRGLGEAGEVDATGQHDFSPAVKQFSAPRQVRSCCALLSVASRLALIHANA